MKSPILLLKEITDLYVRKNFEKLDDYFGNENQLLGFKFVEFSTDGAVTNLKVKHFFNSKPKDLVRARKTGSGSVTFNRHLFDSENLDITTTGPAKVRLFVGTYWNDESQTNDEPTDTETWT